MGARREDDVDVPGLEFRRDIEEPEPPHLDARLRNRLHRRGDGRGRQRARARGDDADPQQRRLLIALQGSPPGEQLVVVVLHAPCERQQLAAVPGELDLARAPIEELDVELLLEAADLLAQRRRGDAQPLRRAAEVQLLGEHAEIADDMYRDIHARILVRG